MIRRIRLIVLVVFIVAGSWYGLRSYLPGAVDRDFAAICRAYDVGMAKIQEAGSNSQQPNEPEIAVGIANAI
jgi:hypothetical protein